MTLKKRTAATTEKQKAANRRNALRSTGPRTKRGKLRAARNAITHGINSELAVLPHLENHKDWRTFRQALVTAFKPRNPLEETLVLRVANTLWRLQRTQRHESQLLDREFHYLHNPATLDNPTPSDLPLPGLLPESPDLERIVRYERHLHFLLHRDLRELRRLRNETALDPPVDSDPDGLEKISPQDLLRIALDGATKTRDELRRQRGLPPTKLPCNQDPDIPLGDIFPWVDECEREIEERNRHPYVAPHPADDLDDFNDDLDDPDPTPPPDHPSHSEKHPKTTTQNPLSTPS